MAQSTSETCVHAVHVSKGVQKGVDLNRDGEGAPRRATGLVEANANRFSKTDSTPPHLLALWNIIVACSLQFPLPEYIFYDSILLCVRTSGIEGKFLKTLREPWPHHHQHPQIMP